MKNSARAWMLCLGVGFASGAVADVLPLMTFTQPASAVTVSAEQVTRADTLEQTATGEAMRRFTFLPDAAPRIRLTPAAAAWNWADAGALSIRLQNAMPWALTLDISIESSDGQSLRSRIALPAGPAQELLIPLRAYSPRQQGMRAGLPSALAQSVEGALNRADVRAITLTVPAPNAPQALLLGQIGTRSEADFSAQVQQLYRGIVDEYGQFTRTDWPEKIHNEAELKNDIASENNWLQQMSAQQSPKDRFGGVLGGPVFSASGFFRTEQREGRWYLVTPEGNPFYSLGVNAVSALQSATYVEGREFMFNGLPAASPFYGHSDHRRDDMLASKGMQFANGRWFDFYRANLARSYGSDDAQRWAVHAVARLQAWGFNTLGNWSDPAVIERQRMPYSLPLVVKGDFATVSTGFDLWGGMPDPFDPRFVAAVERAVQLVTQGRRDDPWLIGYFADNELAWAGIGEPAAARYALALGSLRGKAESPAKQAFIAQLRTRYGDISALAAAWGIALADWQALHAEGFQAPLPREQHPAIAEDFQRFQRLYADTYFKIIREHLSAAAPQHLLLGGRFAISTPEAVAACAQYCDVVSFNFYTREPQHGYDFAVLRALNKPLMVTEFHFGSRDRGPFWGGVQEVWTEEQRGAAYAHFVQRALEEPSIVGLHWFQYLDQPVTGRLLDGENGHLGLVAITDRPYRGFAETVARVNQQVMETLNSRFNAAPISSVR